MGFGMGLMDILGAAGNAVQKYPADVAQVQKIKETAQSMEDARIESGTKNLTMLMNLGSQVPSLQTSPGYQDAVGKVFSGMGIDPKTLPKNEQGGFDFSAGTMSAEFSKNFSNPQNYKAFSALDSTGRQQAYQAWGGTGTMPAWLGQLPQTITPVPEGLNTTIDSAVKNVQGGGDPISSIGVLKTSFDQMPEGPHKDQMLNDAVNSVLSASASPQAKLAIATKNADYQKLVQDYRNAITTGKVDNATLQEDLARVGLIKAQTKTEQGKPAVQVSEIQHNIASTAAAWAAVSKDAVDEQHTNLENAGLLSKYQFNQQHGLPLDTSDLARVQQINASLSNQVKQWGSVKQAARKDLDALQNALNTNSSGTGARLPNPNYNANDPSSTKFLPSAADQATAQQLHSYYMSANQQLFQAQHRQQQAQSIVALPNGQRPNVTSQPQHQTSVNYNGKTYVTGQSYKGSDGKMHTYNGGPVTDTNSWSH